MHRSSASEWPCHIMMDRDMDRDTALPIMGSIRDFKQKLSYSVSTHAAGGVL